MRHDAMRMLLWTGLLLLVASAPARAARATVRLDGGFATIDQAIARNPGWTAGGELEIGLAEWIALLGRVDTYHWATEGTSRFVPSSVGSSDFGFGLRLSWPSGPVRPYVDLEGMVAHGDIDGAPGLGAQAGVGLTWKRANGPDVFVEARGAGLSDMEESSSLASGRIGISIPLARR